MSDPLGLISAGHGGLAQGPGRIGIGHLPGQPGTGQGDGRGPGGVSFKDVLLQNIEKVNALQQEATRATEDFATGRRQDLENVLLATQKADTAFRMLLSVRNKVQAAYDELKQVRI
jgi:flagellar hook-basal body complex protein FliE